MAPIAARMEGLQLILSFMLKSVTLDWRNFMPPNPGNPPFYKAS